MKHLSSHIKWDNQNLSNLLSWFAAHDTFDIKVSPPISLSTGFVAFPEDGVNCKEAENVSEKIQVSLDGL